MLVPCPLQGHLNPMLQLGAILHCRGFSITIAHTAYNSPSPQSLVAADFNFLPIPDGLSDGDMSSGDLVSLALKINDHCRVSLQQSLVMMMEEQDQWDEEPAVTCIISDELMYFAETVADNLKLPSIILRTTSAATAIARPALLHLKAQGLIPFQGSLGSLI